MRRSRTSFSDLLSEWPAERVLALIAQQDNEAAVQRALSDRGFSPARGAALLSPTAGRKLESMARASQALTRQRFGHAVQLFAPLYVSNFCINACRYCGFNRENQIKRRALTLAQAEAEAELIRAEGFRHILLVSGEDRKHASVAYLAELARCLKSRFASINIEVYPLNEAEYATLCQAGVDSMTLYQESYERTLYADMHPAGPKRQFDWRLATPERAARAGIEFLGIGALFGLGDWRREAFHLALHARFLQQRCWRQHVSISLPRLRDAAGLEGIPNPVSDMALVQMTCALRLLLPDAGLVLSTREAADLRDHLLPLGITRMSAGSRTSPGGYGEDETAEEQFATADRRAPETVVNVLRKNGFDPVFKDWDAAYADTVAKSAL